VLVHVACTCSGLHEWFLSVLCMSWMSSTWAHGIIVLVKIHKQKDVVTVKAQVTIAYSRNQLFRLTQTRMTSSLNDPRFLVIRLLAPENTGSASAGALVAGMAR
jgi:hypothetical protein